MREQDSRNKSFDVEGHFMSLEDGFLELEKRPKNKDPELDTMDFNEVLEKIYSILDECDDEKVKVAISVKVG